MSKEEEFKPINIIYVDENFKDFHKEIIEDCQKIIKGTKGTLILIKNLDLLKFFLKYISRSNPKSKFALIINGSSSKKVINYIKNSNYINFFVRACIYCASEDKYSDIKEANKDFVGDISTDVKSIISFVKYYFDTLTNIELLNCNIIMNLYSYDYDYFNLHQCVAKYYLNNKFFDESKIKPSLNKNNNSNINILINKLYQFYILFKNKTNQEFIFNFLKTEKLSTLLNQILIKKEKSDFEQISYFTGNLMYRIVEYGFSEKKGITSGAELYKGMQLDIINLFEYIRNETFLISYSHFMTITSKKQLAELNSQRNIPLVYRKNKNLFSVMITFHYLHDNEFAPSIFNISELVPYPDEEEFIVLPFTFFMLNKVVINENKMNVDIDMTVIGKSEILEEKVKLGKKLFFNEKNYTMQPIENV